MGDAGVPCGACQDTGRGAGRSAISRRGEMIVDVDYPTPHAVPIRRSAARFKLSDSPVAVSRPPLLGEHTDVLA